MWLLLSLASCVPVPALSPPMRLGAAIGPSLTAGAADVPLEVTAEAGLAPLGVFPKLEDRTWDPVLGATFTVPFFNAAPLARLGPYAQLRHRTWQRALQSGRHVVAGPDATVFASFLLDDPGTISIGGRLGGSIELTGWSAGPSIGIGTDGGFIGVAYGQWSIGLGGGLAVRGTTIGPAWSFTLGVVGTAPASAGIALIPVFR